MLRAASLIAMASAASAVSISSLSTHEVEVLKVELTSWTASTAGLEALENGFYTPSSDLMEDLQTLLDTKQQIKEASLANPDAFFSVDTPFALMTEKAFAEFVQNGFRGAEEALAGLEKADITDVVPKAEVDWRESGCVSPIQQQGSCGSCWSFSAVAAAEGAHCLSNGGGASNFEKFGEQELLVCCTDQSQACKGGHPVSAMKWIAQNGLCKIADDPYKAGGGQAGTCQPRCPRVKLEITSGQQLQAGDAGTVGGLNKSPIGVVTCSGNNTWKNYKGGVVSSCENCRGDHAIAAIGYDAESINIKNSWGTSWGEQGHMRLKRVSTGTDGTCLITSMPHITPMKNNPTPTPKPTTPKPTTPKPTTQEPTPAPTTEYPTPAPTTEYPTPVPSPTRTPSPPSPGGATCECIGGDCDDMGKCTGCKLLVCTV